MDKDRWIDIISINELQDNSPSINTTKRDESLQIHPIEEQCRLHSLIDPWNSILLTDTDNTSAQQKIQAKANHLVILPKDDQQGNHLQINMVSVLRQIHQIRRTGGSNHIRPLADPLIDMDNTNDLCKKEIKDRHHSSLLMHPTEIHLHIPPLSDPLSNVPLTDKDNTGSRRRNQDQQRN